MKYLLFLLLCSTLSFASASQDAANRKKAAEQVLLAIPKLTDPNILVTITGDHVEMIDKSYSPIHSITMRFHKDVFYHASIPLAVATQNGIINSHEANQDFAQLKKIIDEYDQAYAIDTSEHNKRIYDVYMNEGRRTIVKCSQTHAPAPQYHNQAALLHLAAHTANVQSELKQRASLKTAQPTPVAQQPATPPQSVATVLAQAQDPEPRFAQQRERSIFDDCDFCDACDTPLICCLPDSCCDDCTIS